MKKILVSQELDDMCRQKLSYLGYECISLPKCEELPEEVSCHPDTLIFKRKNGLLTTESYYNKNRIFFDSLNVKIKTTAALFGKEYPHDILLNAVMTKDGILFSNTLYTAEEIIKDAEKTVKVKQGYTRCSTCEVAEKAFITADKGLFSAYTEQGLDCLLISSGNIRLNNRHYGFIGGCSVKICDDILAFFGDITKHPDYELIRLFTEKYGVKIISLSNGDLNDHGGGVVIE